MGEHSAMHLTLDAARLQPRWCSHPSQAQGQTWGGGHSAMHLTLDAARLQPRWCSHPSQAWGQTWGSIQPCT